MLRKVRNNLIGLGMLLVFMISMIVIFSFGIVKAQSPELSFKETIMEMVSDKIVDRLLNRGEYELGGVAVSPAASGGTSHTRGSFDIRGNLTVRGTDNSMLIYTTNTLVHTGADATKTCGVYHEQNDTGYDLELIVPSLNTNASSVPTSSYFLFAGFVSSTQASSSLERDDAYATTANGVFKWDIPSTTGLTYNTLDSTTYSGMGYSTTWPEDWYFCVTASATDMVDASSENGRYICGGDEEGCNNASVTNNFGYFSFQLKRKD